MRELNPNPNGQLNSRNTTTTKIGLSIKIQNTALLSSFESPADSGAAAAAVENSQKSFIWLTSKLAIELEREEKKKKKNSVN